MKQYVYKVYDSSDNYITTWTDVISEFSTSLEINTAGSQVKIVLGRSAESIVTTSDVVLNNHIVIQVIDNDSDAVGGKTIFTGYIADFNPVYTSDNDSIDVTVLSFGSDLDNYMIDIGDSIVQNEFTTITSNNFVAQSFIPTSNMYVQSIDVWMKTDSTTLTAFASVLRLVQGNPNGVFPNPAPSGTLLATINKYISNDSWQKVSYVFDSIITLTADTEYYFDIKCGIGVSPDIDLELQVSTLNRYTAGSLYTSFDDTEYVISTNRDLRFKVNGSTELRYTLTDPSSMLSEILDIYATFGGNISYTGSTIDTTGSTTNYTFSSNTILEGVRKCLELAPSDWYWYVDPRTNLLHFHKRSSTAEHELALGLDVSQVSVEYRTEDIVNAVYFTGGDGLFKKYIRQDSINTYGMRAIRYTDQRVTHAETAKIISDTILEAHQSPEIRLTVEVIDNADGVHGLDLESIDVGDMVKFRNFGTTDGSLWDVSFWDVAYWNFNPLQLDTLLLQIIKISLTPDKATLYLSTIPPDVNKRIEDINRRLLAIETINNSIVST